MDFRNRIHWFTFILSLLVVWVHSYNAELFLGAWGGLSMAGRFQQLLGEGLGQIAVPGFFMVSAYLFYRGFSMKDLLRKWRSRAGSVLVPYLLWNLLYYGAYVIVSRLPFLTPVIGKAPVPVTADHLCQAVVHYGYNPVFWYLYQLLLLILLSPVIYWIFKSTRRGAAALALMAAGLWWNRDLPVLNLDALFYYSAAAYCGLHRESWGAAAEQCLPLKRLPAELAVLAAGYSLLILLGQPGGFLYGRALSIVLLRFWGVWTAWRLLGALPLGPAREWMKNSFFLYAIHFGLVRLINKSGALVLAGSSLAAMSLFLIMPVLITAAAAWLKKGICLVWPGLYRVLSGGR